MKKKILIDGEIDNTVKVALVNDKDQVEDFDFILPWASHTLGNIYIVKPQRLEKSLQAFFVNYGEKDQGFLPFANISHNIFNGQDCDIKNGKNLDFDKIIKQQKMFLAQVIREKNEPKRALMTADIALIGKFCRFLPFANYGWKISDLLTQEQKDKINPMLSGIGIPENSGAVLHTFENKISKRLIKKDIDYLIKLWQKIQKKANQKLPGLVYEGNDIIKRCIRDMYDQNVEKILVSGENCYKKVMDFTADIVQKKKLELFSKPANIFSEYGVLKQIDSIYENCVELESGAHIVFSYHEALTSIDINSSRSTKNKQLQNLEDTALHINLESIETIYKHILLKGISGIIAIDFIDMQHKDNIAKVEKELKNVFKNEKAIYQIDKMSKFCTILISRQRLKNNIFDQAFDRCTSCNGFGFIRNDRVILVIESILEELQNSKDGYLYQISLNKKMMQNITEYYLDFIKYLQDKYQSDFMYNIIDNEEFEISKIQKIARGVCKKITKAPQKEFKEKNTKKGLEENKNKKSPKVKKEDKANTNLKTKSIPKSNCKNEKTKGIENDLEFNRVFNAVGAVNKMSMGRSLDQSKKLNDKKTGNIKLPGNINPKFTSKKSEKLLEKNIKSKMHPNSKKNNRNNQNKQSQKEKLVNKKGTKQDGFVQKALDRVFGKTSANKKSTKKNTKNTYH